MTGSGGEVSGEPGPPDESEYTPEETLEAYKQVRLLLLRMEDAGQVFRMKSPEHRGHTVWMRGESTKDSEWQRALDLARLARQYVFTDRRTPSEVPDTPEALADLVAVVVADMERRDETDARSEPDDTRDDERDDEENALVSIGPGEERHYDESVESYTYDRHVVPPTEQTRRGLLIGLAIAFVGVLLLQLAFALFLDEAAWARVGPILSTVATLVAAGFGYAWGHYFSGRH